MRISWLESKKKLAVLWFIGASLIFLIVFFQTILGRYGVNADSVWSWFLPTVMPTLSLIIGVLVADSLGKEIKTHTTDRFLFRLSFILSFIYLITVLMTLLLEPFSTLSAKELMEQSNLWLGPFQGLTSATLGAFFIQSK